MQGDLFDQRDRRQNGQYKRWERLCLYPGELCGSPWILFWDTKTNGF
jgi:hypothetical protein